MKRLIESGLLIIINIFILFTAIYGWMTQNTYSNASGILGVIEDKLSIIDMNNSSAYYLDKSLDSYLIGEQITNDRIELNNYNELLEKSRKQEILLKLKISTNTSIDFISIYISTSSPTFSTSLDANNESELSNIIEFYNTTVGDNNVYLDNKTSFITEDNGLVLLSKRSNINIINNLSINEEYAYITLGINEIALDEIYFANLGYNSLDLSISFNMDFSIYVTGA